MTASTTDHAPRPPLRRAVRLVAVGGGLVFALATPPFDVLPAVLVGLVALAWTLDRSTRARDAALAAFLWACAANLLGLRFVAPVVARFTPLGLAGGVGATLAIAGLQAIPWAMGAALGATLRLRWSAPLQLAHGLAVMVAVSAPAVIRWTPAGLLSPWPAPVQLAELVGERGVSVALALAAAICARAVERVRLGAEGARTKASRELGLVAAGLGLATGLGAWRMTQLATEGREDARIALVQAAVAPEERWRPERWPHILAALRRETALAENDGVELTVWPEAAYPYPLRHDTRAMPRGQREVVGGAIDGPVLLGFLANESPQVRPDGTVVQDTTNSATIVGADRSLAPPHDKMELLAFGEAVPFGDTFPWLRRVFQRSGGLRPGRTLRRLDVERRGGAPLRLGVLNCYEDTLPAHGRRVLRELEPNLLVNLTNDAWFTGTAAPTLHLRLAAMRTIELRRDLVRAVNLGPSAWIDATGRVRAVRDAAEPDFLRVTPSLRADPPTLYARAGDAPTWAALALAALVVAVRARRASTKPTAG